MDISVGKGLKMLSGAQVLYAAFNLSSGGVIGEAALWAVSSAGMYYFGNKLEAAEQSAPTVK